MNSEYYIVKVYSSKEEVEAVKRIQRMYQRHYTTRKVTAIKICNAALNWVWKPICKDGAMGIRLRLDMKDLRKFFPCTQMSAACKIQRAYLRHYTRRQVAAYKIIRGCHNWIWSPKCRDTGLPGIRPRLDTQYLGLFG